MYYPIGWSRTLKIRRRRLNKNLNINCVQDNNSNNDNELNNNTNTDNSNEKIDIKLILNNVERTLILVLTNHALQIWCSKPSILIVSHHRSEQSLNDYGENVNAIWRPDSSMIVISTTSDFLLFYKLTIKNQKEALLEQTDVNVPGFKRESSELFIPEKIPLLLLLYAYSCKITNGICSLMAAEEEIVVCTKLCEIIGVNWDGSLDKGLQWNLKNRINIPNSSSSGSIPTTITSSSSSSSLQTPSTNVTDLENNFNICDIEYSSIIGGFSLVFVNGKAAFMTHQADENGSDSKYSLTRLQFVSDVDGCLTTAVSHKYQLLAYGLKNSDGILCCIDELTNSVIITHRLTLPSSSYPNASSQIGGLVCLRFSPDSNVIAASWERGAFAIWSVFGALLMCSMSWDLEVQPKISSISWGKEGYKLFMVNKSDENNRDDQVISLSMAKSILTSNPSCMSCCGEIVMLVSEDRLFLGVGSTLSKTQHYRHQHIASNVEQNVKYDTKQECQRNTDTKHSLNSLNLIEVIDVEGESRSSGSDNSKLTDNSSTQTAITKYSQSDIVTLEQGPIGDGNHQWITIQMPYTYLSVNWPVRYVTVDPKGNHIAIAGRNGFALCTVNNVRWKVFGNERQEKDFEVCGGLLWYEENVILSCYNSSDERFELRAYSRKNKLDTTLARIVKIPNEILLMSLLDNRLLVLLIDGSFILFKLETSVKERKNINDKSHNVYNYEKSSLINIIKLNEIVVSNVMAPAECITGIVLSSVHIEASDNDSILMNICGKLFLLEQDSQKNSSNNINNNYKNNRLVYKAVSILASGVENIWVSQRNTSNESERPHLTDSLWIACGGNGTGVWLPLLLSETEKTAPLSRAHNFISKRIMLPINTHIYPLAVLFHDAIVLGVENDTMLGSKMSSTKLPFNTITRTSQVYLHHILRELLKRNLGIHAWEIANSCRSLPYFPHSLELLLHEVLEEEATSSQPIPDALLPVVIDFIREYPVFLETVAHCARKTELALWPHLFSVVGNPKELFQKCIEDKNLNTAASYIIILQNLEKSSISRQYATKLLEIALNSGFWSLAEDLLRFLRAIEPEMENHDLPVKASLNVTNGVSHPHLMKYIVSPNSLVNNNKEKRNSVDNHPHHSHLNHPHQPVVIQGRKRTQSSSSNLTLHSNNVVGTSVTAVVSSSNNNSSQTSISQVNSDNEEMCCIQ